MGFETSLEQFSRMLKFALTNLPTPKWTRLIFHFKELARTNQNPPVYHSMIRCIFAYPHFFSFFLKEKIKRLPFVDVNMLQTQKNKIDVSY
jgi:hypothetical protein